MRLWPQASDCSSSSIRIAAKRLATADVIDIDQDHQIEVHRKARQSLDWQQPPLLVLQSALLCLCCCRRLRIRSNLGCSSVEALHLLKEVEAAENSLIVLHTGTNAFISEATCTVLIILGKAG